MLRCLNKIPTCNANCCLAGYHLFMECSLYRLGLVGYPSADIQMEDNPMLSFTDTLHTDACSLNLHVAVNTNLTDKHAQWCSTFEAFQGKVDLFLWFISLFGSQKEKKWQGINQKHDGENYKLQDVMNQSDSWKLTNLSHGKTCWTKRVKVQDCQVKMKCKCWNVEWTALPTDLLLQFTNVLPFLSLLYRLFSCSPLGRWLWWKRRAFRGLLAAASAMLIWGYLTWASRAASICLHLSHSVCASRCLCLSQQSLIICSRYNKCSGTLSFRYSFDKHTTGYICVYKHTHVTATQTQTRTHLSYLA